MADATGTSGATGEFRAARDSLLGHREDYGASRQGFAWPRPAHFNRALDWFDPMAEGTARTALHIVEEDGSEPRRTFEELRRRSAHVANWLAAQGVRAGDRIVVMLGNQVELWETALAAMKPRAVVIPATPLLGPADLAGRVARGRARQVLVRAEDTGKFADVPGDYPRVAVGGAPQGRIAYEESHHSPEVYAADGPTPADETLMPYFTSGTTASMGRPTPGYHGEPERTAEAMAGGYYRTGDIGSRDSDGCITYIGRAHDVLMTSRSGGSSFPLRLAA